VRHRLGNPQPFVPAGIARSECAQLGVAAGEVGMGVHGKHDDLTEAFIA
jgi:hypothetical protein